MRKRDNVVLVGAVNNRYALAKRGMDILISSAGLLVTSPILLATAVAIKVDSRGPILFKQKRTGKNGVNFDLLKFRSMAADNDVHDFSCEDKYTKVGRLIRKTSIDELPQLINVLRGDMSIIGPRPWIPDYYKNMDAEQRRKYDVRPGITGLAQVKGRNALSVFERIKYDLVYVDNYSLRQDLKVLALTAKAVLRPAITEAAISKSGIRDDIDDLTWRKALGSQKAITILPGDDFAETGRIEIISTSTK